MKKQYNKPRVCGIEMTNSVEQLAPLGPAAALVGGYVAGRAAKKAMDVRPENKQMNLSSVIM